MSVGIDRSFTDSIERRVGLVRGEMALQRRRVGQQRGARAAWAITPRLRMIASSVKGRIFFGFCSTMIIDRPSPRELAQRAEQFVDDDRREALGRLVEQQQPRVEHQRAADRQHLLLAARQLAAACCGAARAGAGTSRRRARASTGPAVATAVRFSSTRQRAEDVALLRRPADAAPRARMRRQRVTSVAAKNDAAGVARGDADQRVEQRRLADAVASEQRERLAVVEREARGRR